MTEPTYDKRRRQYIPLAVTFAFSPTGKRLLNKFGRDGLLAWVCFLAACKTNWIQGQLSYTSEPDGWSKLGLYGWEPEFTLDAFFTFTGRLKQTSRRRSGDITDVFCTRWDEWNKEVRRQIDAEQKSSKRGENTETSQRQSGDETATLRRTEVEVEEEVRATTTSERARAIADRMSSVAKSGFADRVTADRAQLLLDSFPNVDVESELGWFIDWHENGAGATQNVKDSIAGFRNWLARSKPKGKEAQDGASVIDFSAYDRAVNV